MPYTPEQRYWTVVEIARLFLRDEEDRSAITLDLINEKIDLVLFMSPKWGIDLDRQAVIRDLIYRFQLDFKIDAPSKDAPSNAEVRHHS